MDCDIIPFPQELRPKLPTIVGNVDYLILRERLEQIDALLRDGGVEEDFVRRALNTWTPEEREAATACQQIQFQQRSRRPSAARHWPSDIRGVPSGCLCL